MSTRGKALKALVSVVIPVEPGGSVGACLEALKRLPTAEKRLISEVLVAEGLHPSRQRNAALEAARAPWVLFLDSDSLLSPSALPHLLACASQFGAAMVGGPNLPLIHEPYWGRAFQRVLASWAGSMRSKARYAPVGKARVAGEKELILCHLLADRKTLTRVGGFREDLYPNEENELFNRLQDQGHVLAYEPLAQVRRPRRRGPGEFVVQAFRYGRGRAQQMRANFFPSDLVNLLPLSLFLFWPVIGLLHPAWAVTLVAILVGASALILGPVFSSESLPFVPLLFLRHHAYAMGLIVGSLQDAAARPGKVVLKRLEL